MRNAIRQALRSLTPATSLISCTVVLLSQALTGTAVAQQVASQASSEQITVLSTGMEELRKENQALRQRLDAIEVGAAKAAPVDATAFKFNGEIRTRFEDFEGKNDAFVDRGRLRARLRLGGTATRNDLEAGLRLTTGVSEGEPNGNNFTLADNGSKKAIAVDLAYLKWQAYRSDLNQLAIIGGKMNNPLSANDLVLDGDYTPEGVAAQYSHKFGTNTLRFNTGLLVIDELSASSHDPLLYVGQVRWDASLGSNTTSIGFTNLQLANASQLTNTSVPDVQKGNTRTADGVLTEHYRPWLLDASVTHKVGMLPVRLGLDYMHNPGASDDNNAYHAGLFVGKAEARHTWELSYRYRVAEADVWYEELIDSDSGAYYRVAPPGGSAGYGGGTNVRGHILAGNYALTDRTLAGFTYYSMDLINASPAGSDSGMGRLQMNVIAKF
jgi:Putative porin